MISKEEKQYKEFYKKYAISSEVTVGIPYRCAHCDVLLVASSGKAVRGVFITEFDFVCNECLEYYHNIKFHPKGTVFERE